MKTRKSEQDRERNEARRKVDDIPLTPMIDVVFQLLVFFVFTFESIDVFAELPFDRPAAEPGACVAPSPNQVRIRVGVDEYGLMDRPLSLDRMDTALGRLATIDTNQLIIVEAHATAQHDRLIAVMNLFAKHKLTRISLISLD